MSEQSPENRMKPLVVLQTGTVSKADIKRLRNNGLCVIESDDPSSVRFKEPPPFGYSAAETAAIQLFRYVMAKPGDWTRFKLSQKYAEILLHGSPLEPCDDIAQLKSGH